MLGEAFRDQRIVQRARRLRPSGDRAHDTVGLAPVRTVALVDQSGVHHRPAGVDVADAAGVGHPHVGVEGDVRALAAQRVNWRDLDARRVHRDEEHREALVLGLVRARTGEQEHIIGDVRDRREHLLPVDLPLVPVAHRSGLHGGDVGAGVGLAVAEACQRVAGQHARHDLRALLFVAEQHERRCDHRHDPHAVDGGARSVQLLHQRGRLHRAAAATAHLDRPPGGQIPAGGDGAVQGVVVHRPGRMRPLDDLVGEMLGEERAHLLTERLGRWLQPALQSVTSLTPQPVGDGEQPALRVAQRDARLLGPLHVEVHVVLEHEPVAAVDVQARLGRVDRHLAAPPVGHRRQRRGIIIGIVERDRRFVGEQLASGHRRVDVGETMLDRLEGPDRHPELMTFLDVGDTDLEHGAGQTCAPRRRQRQPTVVACGRHRVDERNEREMSTALAGDHREIGDRRVAGRRGIEQAHVDEPVPRRLIETDGLQCSDLLGRRGLRQQPADSLVEGLLLFGEERVRQPRAPLNRVRRSTATRRSWRRRSRAPRATPRRCAGRPSAPWWGSGAPRRAA